MDDGTSKPIPIGAVPKYAWGLVVAYSGNACVNVPVYAATRFVVPLSPVPRDRASFYSDCGLLDGRSTRTAA